MLYQSQSGDAEDGTSSFYCDSSDLEILSTSSVASTAPFFFITNTEAQISLQNCSFTFSSGVFLNASGTSEWGSSGSNGGVVTLNLTNQIIEGNFVVNSDSGLTINMVNSTITGTFNSDKTAAKLAIVLDASSTITLTGNSYYTSLTNAQTDGSNLINDSYSWTETDESTISTGGSGNTENTGTKGSPSTSNNSSSSSSSSTTSTSDSTRAYFFKIISFFIALCLL